MSFPHRFNLTACQPSLSRQPHGAAVVTYYTHKILDPGFILSLLTYPKQASKHVPPGHYRLLKLQPREGSEEIPLREVLRPSSQGHCQALPWRGDQGLHQLQGPEALVKSCCCWSSRRWHGASQSFIPFPLPIRSQLASSPLPKMSCRVVSSMKC